eukprot:CAMPEP_0119128272 /NCGR_PEP_ID=MMETSP1310-20130426/6492_1 /TAXON_ID=464262 /ORGANISM="Genus nov. species nov., Strain RCC2339" /LENGTH=775 /DNA_ID=CAMNT_0007118599 /DNA_START=159 /DNA_END=2486 /DNA_ORIENTATION=-
MGKVVIKNPAKWHEDGGVRHNVKEVVVEGGDWHEFPQGLDANFPNIVRLTITKTRCREIPTDLGRFQSLTHVTLSYNQIEHADNPIIWPSSLRSLKLFHNRLSHFPCALKAGCEQQLPHLTHLNLANNSIQVVDAACRLPPGLEQLVMNKNELAAFPDHLFLSNTPTQLRLSLLSLSSNRLSGPLSDAVCLLTNLTVLSFAENSLTSLPHEIGFLSLLQFLELHHNRLTFLPSTLCELRSLKSLNVSNNQLIRLPHDMGNLHTLESLNVSNNSLYNVPSSIGLCRKLSRLNVSNNRLHALPEILSTLPALEELLVSANRLSSLPRNFHFFYGVQKVDLSLNPLRMLPPSFRDANIMQLLYDSSSLQECVPRDRKKMEEVSQVATLSDLCATVCVRFLPNCPLLHQLLRTLIREEVTMMSKEKLSVFGASPNGERELARLHAAKHGGSGGEVRGCWFRMLPPMAQLVLLSRVRLCDRSQCHGPLVGAGRYMGRVVSRLGCGAPYVEEQHYCCQPYAQSHYRALHDDLRDMGRDGYEKQERGLVESLLSPDANFELWSVPHDGGAHRAREYDKRRRDHSRPSAPQARSRPDGPRGQGEGQGGAPKGEKRSFFARLLAPFSSSGGEGEHGGLSGGTRGSIVRRPLDGGQGEGADAAYIGVPQNVLDEAAVRPSAPVGEDVPLSNIPCPPVRRAAPAVSTSCGGDSAKVGEAHSLGLPPPGATGTGESMRECRVCLEAATNCVLIPCGHMGLCSGCARKVHECPFCRSSITFVQETFAV